MALKLLRALIKSQVLTAYPSIIDVFWLGYPGEGALMSVAEILPIKSDVMQELLLPSLDVYRYQSNFAVSLRTISMASGTGNIGMEFDMMAYGMRGGRRPELERTFTAHYETVDNRR
jgi:hypothetical protein